MLWKDFLASMIRANPKLNTSYDSWVEIRSKFPRVRFKTFDTKGRVVAIQLEGAGDWMKPSEWADLHIQNLLQRVHDDGERLAVILPQAEAAELISGALPTMRLSTSEQYSKLSEEHDTIVSKLSLAEKQIKELARRSSDYRDQVSQLTYDRKMLEAQVNRMLTIIRENVSITTPKAIRELVK